jgi:predicted Zn finger-like uncharacterized protein
MSIAVRCPHCSASFQVKDEFAGKAGGCPNCKRRISVPQTAESVAARSKPMPSSTGPLDEDGFLRTVFDSPSDGLAKSAQAPISSAGVDDQQLRSTAALIQGDKNWQAVVASSADADGSPWNTAEDSQRRCPKCHTTLALRPKPGTYRVTSLLGQYGHEYHVDRFCPQCSGTSCYINGCPSAATTVLAHRKTTYRPNKYSKPLVVRNDLCVCARHAKLIESYRRGPAIISAVLFYIGSAGLHGIWITAIWGYFSQWSSKSLFGLASSVIGMLLGLSGSYAIERRFETSKKPEFSVITGPGYECPDLGVCSDDLHSMNEPDGGTA